MTLETRCQESDLERRRFLMTFLGQSLNCLDSKVVVLCVTQVRRDLAAGRLPPVQPFHAMAYPFSAELALAISAKYAEYCAVTAGRLNLPPLPVRCSHFSISCPS